MSANGTTIQFRVSRLPKRGNSDEEYEDASAANVERGRFAIADGATESSYAGLWARLLVDGFVNAPAAAPRDWSSWLPEQQKRWLEEMNGRPMPWYGEIKVEQGAFATFLGLIVDEVRWPWRDGRWRAIAVGDGCLFQVRAGQLRKKFPMSLSTDFGSSPGLIGSRAAIDSGLEKKQTQTRGKWRAGDRLWLMTDALAQWFLHEVEAGHKPWEKLESLLTPPATDETFAAWIEELRDAQELRNDDVTLLAICL